MMRLSRIVGTLALMALVTLTPAAGQNAAYVEPANLTDLIAAAAKEGTLDLSAGASLGGLRGAQVVQDHINAKYHLHLTIRFTPVAAGEPFVQQLIQEIRAGQPASSDIIFSLTDHEDVPYVQRVDWRKYVPGLAPDVGLYDWHAVKVLTALNAFDYNTKLVPPDQVPKSFADFLKPQWKGKIATSPYAGRFINYLGLPNVFGHQGMLDYIRKFSDQVGGIMVCGEVDRVVSGEFLIFGPDCGDHEVRLRERKGEPIGAIYPKEGTQVNYVVPAIPNTVVHPNAARLYLAYLLTRAGQEDMWNVVGRDCDLLPGSHMARVIADLRRRGVNLVPGGSGTGMDVTHPELDAYTREIDAIINRGK